MDEEQDYSGGKGLFWIALTIILVGIALIGLFATGVVDLLLRI